MTESIPPDQQADVERLADALLDAIEGDVDTNSPDTQMPAVLNTAALAFRRLGIDFVRRYNRLDVDTEPSTFDCPVLFVANHGFGGLFDLNVFATGATLERLELDRPCAPDAAGWRRRRPLRGLRTTVMP
jgi:hypothetical protein